MIVENNTNEFDILFNIFGLGERFNSIINGLIYQSSSEYNMISDSFDKIYDMIFKKVNIFAPFYISEIKYDILKSSIFYDAKFDITYPATKKKVYVEKRNIPLFAFIIDFDSKTMIKIDKEHNMIPITLCNGIENDEDDMEYNALDVQEIVSINESEIIKIISSIRSGFIFFALENQVTTNSEFSKYNPSIMDKFFKKGNRFSSIYYYYSKWNNGETLSLNTVNFYVPDTRSNFQKEMDNEIKNILKTGKGSFSFSITGINNKDDENDK